MSTINTASNLPFTAHTACRHVRHLLPQMADGKLCGFLLIYVRAHIQKCTQCTAVLESLIALRDRMRLLGSKTTGETVNRLQEDNRVALERRLLALERLHEDD